MLADLKFVRGSVAKKDFLPALTHFVIENGTVRGFNGTIALCTPIPFDITCKPKAEPMVRAIMNCQETVSLSLTPAGKLRIQSGVFRAFVECVDGETQHVEPEGEPLEINGQGLFDALTAVQPFVGDDASRPWTTGVLLKGESAYATNNVAIVEFWTGSKVSAEINIPGAAVKEIVRIGRAPVSARLHERSFTLYYDNGAWLRTQLLPTEWPDLSRILNSDAVPMTEIPEAFYEGLEVLRPFVDKMGRIFFQDYGMCTHPVGEEGASYEMPGKFNYDGVFNVEILRLLKGTATHVGFANYPKPVPFYGANLRGCLMGLRK